MVFINKEVFMKKIIFCSLKFAVFAFFSLYGAWMLISFFDIISHNMEGYDGYAQYLDWNFFCVMPRFINNFI